MARAARKPSQHAGPAENACVIVVPSGCSRAVSKAAFVACKEAKQRITRVKISDRDAFQCIENETIGVFLAGNARGIVAREEIVKSLASAIFGIVGPGTVYFGKGPSPKFMDERRDVKWSTFVDRVRRVMLVPLHFGSGRMDSTVPPPTRLSHWMRSHFAIQQIAEEFSYRFLGDPPITDSDADVNFGMHYVPPALARQENVDESPLLTRFLGRKIGAMTVHGSEEMELRRAKGEHQHVHGVSASEFGPDQANFPNLADPV